METQYVSVVVVSGVGGGWRYAGTVYVGRYCLDDVTPDRRFEGHIGTGVACFLLQPLCEVTLCAMTV